MRDIKHCIPCQKSTQSYSGAPKGKMNLQETTTNGSDLLPVKKSPSFLTFSNGAICSAVCKAIFIVSQSTTQSKNNEEKGTKTLSKADGTAVDTNKESIPEISLDEVYSHDNIYDCWIVVYDKVFDITSFLREHPGGEEVLLEYAGRDGTLAFNGVGHSNEALKELDKYLIGVLPENERIYSQGRKKVIEMLTTSLSLAS